MNDVTGLEVGGVGAGLMGAGIVIVLAPDGADDVTGLSNVEIEA